MSGEPQTVAEMVAQYQPDVRRFAERLCKSPEDAEDAAQHALWVLWRRFPILQRTAKITTYLFAVVRNECLRFARKALRLQQLKLEPKLASDSGLDQAELLQSVCRAIESLDEDQRVVLLMRDVKGLSGPEVAQQLGISLAAVKSRLHRARLEVRLLVQGRA